MVIHTYIYRSVFEQTKEKVKIKKNYLKQMLKEI